MVFFYHASRMQLKAEGFVIGFLYRVVGLLLGFVPNVLVRMRALEDGFMGSTASSHPFGSEYKMKRGRR